MRWFVKNKTLNGRQRRVVEMTMAVRAWVTLLLLVLAAQDTVLAQTFDSNSTYQTAVNFSAGIVGKSYVFGNKYFTVRRTQLVEVNKHVETSRLRKTAVLNLRLKRFICSVFIPWSKYFNRPACIVYHSKGFFFFFTTFRVLRVLLPLRSVNGLIFFSQRILICRQIHGIWCAWIDKWLE